MTAVSTTPLLPAAMPGVPLRRASAGLWIPLACGTLLMVFTFSFDAEDSPLGGLHPVTTDLKLAVRLLCSVLLAGLLLVRCASPQSVRNLGLCAALVLFAGWAWVSVLWSPLKQVTVSQAASLTTLVLLCLGYAAVCRRCGDLTRVLDHVCLGLCGITGGLLMLRLAVPSMSVMERNGTGLFHPTNAAATASLALLLVLTTRLVWGTAWSRRLVWPMLVVSPAALVFSANRMTLFLTLVLGLLVAAFYTHRLLVAGAVLVGSTAGGLLLAADPNMTLGETVAYEVTAFAARDQTVHQLAEFSGREEMWSVMWLSFLDSPLIGHGYFVTSRTGELDVWYGERNFTAHNMMLQVLVPTGIIGMTLFVLGLLQPAAGCAMRLVRHPERRRIVLTLLPPALWYLGWSQLNESFMGPLQPESVVFFSLLGAAVGVSGFPDKGAPA